MNKHGIPGIGVTAPKGKKGMNGNSFYFGPLNSFFTYIGDDILPDSSVDYEDRDYDITYVLNETRLDPKYKVGDILYITDELHVSYMVEITDDMTTCTREYLLKNAKYIDPFTLKSALNEHTYMYPIDILSANHFVEEGPAGLRIIKNCGLYRVNSLYNKSLMSITRYYPYINMDASVVIDSSSLRDEHTYDYIPYTYFEDRESSVGYKRQELVNDGAGIHKYTYMKFTPPEDSPNPNTSLLSFRAMVSRTSPVPSNNELDMYAVMDEGLFINVENNKLYFDNMYIKNDNIGNVDAYHTLYHPAFALDNDGHCYTLTSADYNSGMQGFIINKNKFLNNISLTGDELNISDYNYGYTHMYWNCGENSSSFNYYMPNYVRGRFLTEEKMNIFVIKKDSDGNYVRNWNNEKFKKIENLEIKDLLVNTYETKTLNDVSNLISRDNPDLLDYLDVSGLICILDTSDYVEYDKIQLINRLVEYRDYGDTMLYVENTSLLPNDESVIVKKEYSKSLIYSVPDPSGEENTYITKLYINPDSSTINRFMDPSYYSGIDYVTNPDSSVIMIDMLAPDGKYYFNHEIVQWIQDKEGIKYFSKTTKAKYNPEILGFEITADWENTNMLSEKEKLDDGYPKPVINIQIKDNLVYVDASNNGNLPYIVSLPKSILENDQHITISSSDGPKRLYTYFSLLDMSDVSTYEDVIGEDVDLSILNDLFNGTYHINIEPAWAIYEIPYTINTAKTGVEGIEKKYVTKVNLNGFLDYRTLPKIKLNGRSDPDALEKSNNPDNGVLCNLFQYFIDIDIDDFDYSNWGQMQEWYNQGIILSVSYNLNYMLTALDPNINLSEVFHTAKLQYLVMSGEDVYNMSWKDLEELNDQEHPTKYTKPLTISSGNQSLVFNASYTLDDVLTNKYKFRVVFETTNPEVVHFKMHMYVQNLKITALSSYGRTVSYEYDGEQKTGKGFIYELDYTHLYNISDVYNSWYLYGTKQFNGVIAPISYIAGYNQEFENAVVVNNCLQGSDEYLRVAVKPYMLEEALNMYTDFVNREYDLPNWNTYKFKRRYLQDNIKAINVYPININDIFNLLVKESPGYDQFKEEYLVSDPDDKYSTYLQLVYDSTKYYSKLIEDQEQFIYNRELYLSSKYSQQENNTAILIEQDTEYNVRSNNLLNSIQIWNKEYLDYRYESDNPFKGHIELYGNGYQYLPVTADQGQYLRDGYMGLNDVKELNKQYFFDTENLESYNYVVNQSDKNDSYTPTKLFRQLLTQLKWIYPKYKSQNGVNLIDRYNLVNNVKKVSSLAPDTIPYNLLYALYPRVMFNDEEQETLILMLRRPSVVNENQYELTTEDVYLEGVEAGELTDPINVLN